MESLKPQLQLSIVLPTYKEKGNIAIFIPQIMAEFTDIPFEVIIVDDHSEDGTGELIQELQKTYTNLRILERPGLLGIGSAIRDGYDMSRGEYILSSDADLSFTPEDMRSLYNKILEGNDLVLGYKIYESTPDQKKTLKVWCETYLYSLISNTIIRFLSGIRLKNFNTNFRIIRSMTWKQFKTIEKRQLFLFEMIFRAKGVGARIAQIPVTFKLRKFGESKVSFFRQAPKYFLKLVRFVYFEKKT